MPFHKICGPVVAPTTSTHYIELHYSCETFVCNELDLRARVIIGTTFSISLILNSRLILRITVEFFGSRASPLNFNILTIANFKIGVPTILFFHEKSN